MSTKLPNQFQMVWHPEKFMEKRDWHSYEKGVYHVSSIGCNHQHLNYDEHSGPCIRATYWDYIDHIKESDETEGNFEMGRDMHKNWQDIVKEWYPQAIIEKTVARPFKRGDRVILIVGSEDIHMPLLYNMEKATSKTKRKIEIWDGKSASSWTMPKGRFDKNPTHFDQTKIYGGFEILFELNTNYNVIVRVKIFYFSKMNKKTYIQREIFHPEEAVEKAGDCVDRAFYLDECVEKGEVPIAEPHKYCRLCRYLDRCIEQGDVEPIMEGKKVKKMVGLKVIGR